MEIVTLTPFINSYMVHIKEVYKTLILEYKCKSMLMPNKDLPFDTNKIFTYLYANIFETDCNVMNLKLYCNISSKNYANRFKRYFGITPASYIKLHRVELSKYLMRALQGERISIGEISWVVGYDSPSAFTMAFKDKVGKSPSEWVMTCFNGENIE